ncbi:methionyl-tRNA formyltransferase [Pasteuria penetrans]|uniref:methionyl-tRNA formyltransferase n=1 Tax=Pasteuria penetrans TaxID=86005 RepID=UPI000F948FCF|nr:methionyl-tRNA formyltransferase [Pasteuria penetrans]
MRVVFMGTPQFAIPSLRALLGSDDCQVVGVVTQPDRSVGRKQVCTPTPVKQVALQHGIPVLQPIRLRAPEAVDAVHRLKPDLIVTAAYGQLIPDDILTLPRYRCLNVHASLLPRYRGGAPIHWALIRGERETGVTIMIMVKELDAGDMVAQVAIPIEPSDDVGTLHDRLSQVGAELLLFIVPAWSSGDLSPVPQDPEKVTYAPNVKRLDERLDFFQQTAQELSYRVRGLSPWPGAFLQRANREIWKVWEVCWRPATTTLGSGYVTSIDRDQGVLWLGAKQDELGLLTIQPAGKRRLPMRDWLRGHSVDVGDRWILPGVVG